jgi:hypothetical protein
MRLFAQADTTAGVLGRSLLGCSTKGSTPTPSRYR